jgi:hypothetical protein
VPAARRHSGAVADLEDLGAEVALAAALDPDEGHDPLPALEQALEHADGPIRAADQEDPGSVARHRGVVEQSACRRTFPPDADSERKLRHRAS